jgi:quercetin dioxygenase-like cupin family protein
MLSFRLNKLVVWVTRHATLKNEDKRAMFKQNLISCASLAALVFLLVNSSSFAQPPAQEPALDRTVQDMQLKWNPCPAFMPKGCVIALLHGDLAKDNADVFFKMPAHSTIPTHSHTSAERIVVVAGELHVTYEGQQTAVIKPGTYAYGPAKRPHNVFCASAEDCVLFIAFESPVDAIPSKDAK